MTEEVRHEIVQRRLVGMSLRAIAEELGVSRGAVARALARVQAQRDGRAAPSPRPRPRKSIIDPFEPILKELLAKYPNLTTERALQELQARGFPGKYTVVRQRIGLLRPRAAAPPVPRFETGPGAQAQMDYGVYDLDFTREGRRRVYLFSYLLSYSRRQYLHFVEAMDLPTTLREHVHAFHHLGGVARVCLYDNFKAVVLRHDADGAFYNPKFLAFATHYGFRPQACRVRRPQTKGKVERQFHFVETSLFNGRTFETLEHLNEVTAQWLQSVADVRTLRDFKESPLERHAVEQPHLLALPTCDFDTAQVVYRHVNVEGYVTHRLNLYSVPWSHIGQVETNFVAPDALAAFEDYEYQHPSFAGRLAYRWRESMLREAILLRLPKRERRERAERLFQFLRTRLPVTSRGVARLYITLTQHAELDSDGYRRALMFWIGQDEVERFRQWLISEVASQRFEGDVLWQVVLDRTGVWPAYRTLAVLEAFESQPDGIPYYLNLEWRRVRARLLNTLRRFREAAVLARGGINLCKDRDPEAAGHLHCLLGVSLAGLRRYKESVKNFRRAEEQYTALSATYSEIGMVMYELSRVYHKGLGLLAEAYLRSW